MIKIYYICVGSTRSSQLLGWFDGVLDGWMDGRSSEMENGNQRAWVTSREQVDWLRMEERDGGGKRFEGGGRAHRRMTV